MSIGAGHYEIETPEQLRERYKREAEELAKENKRRHSRRKREEALMEISGAELPQKELTERISLMLERYKTIVSHIPSPLTLHLSDGEDNWDMSGYLNERGNGRLLYKRELPYHEDETFDLSIISGVAKVTHWEVGLYQVSDSKNSEREIKPAEELFDKLISPLEQKMGI